MTLLLGLVLAADALDLTLERAEAARSVRDWDAAIDLAGEALGLDPHDPRCHFAWQAAHVGAGERWRLDAEYAWLLDGEDPRLAEVAEGWVNASGMPWVAIRLRDEDTTMLAVQGIRSAYDAGEVREAAKRANAALDTWPNRPDLVEPILHDESITTRKVRRRARQSADALMGQGDLLSSYRAYDVYVALGEKEAAQDAIEALEAAGEPFPLTTHRTWRVEYLEDMSQLLALQQEPQLPSGHRPHEEQAALAFTALTLYEKGRYERAAETWRRALALADASPQLLLSAGMGIERGGGDPLEVLAIADEAVVGLAQDGDLVKLSMALHLQARALRRLERPQEALVAATLAAGLGETNALVLRGELLELTGEPDLAFDAYAEAAARGVYGLEEHLERLYSGPASWEAVVADWPLEDLQEVPAASAPQPVPRDALGDVPLGVGPVVINFWASWCAPCRTELPELNGLAAEGAVVVAVSIDDRPEDMERFLQKTPLPEVEAVWDPALARELGVTGIPTTVIVDSGGLVVFRTQGYLPGDVERLAAELDELED